jgi:fucose 4-O-acetylase-like acetyltransferase
VTPPADPPRRLAEVDAVKAIGILTVVWIHTLGPIWSPEATSHTIWWTHVTRFAVPGFLAASGYLYATEGRVLGDVTGRRLVRILVPYAVGSLGAELFWWLRGLPRWGELASDLAFGAAFGQYYYVPQIVLLVLLSPLLARLPGVALGLLTALAVVGQGLVESAAVGADLDLFWSIRNPLRWGAYFLVGWQLRLNRAALLAWLAPRRRGVVVAAVLAAALCAGFPATHTSPAGPRLAAWLGVYATLTAIYATSAGRPAVPPGFRALSDATYAIYLLHLFFVIPLREALGPSLVPEVARSLAVWAGGLLGSLAAIALLRRLLGERARLLVGA